MRKLLLLCLAILLAGCAAPAAPTSVLPPLDASAARRNATYKETECRGGGDNQFFRRERRCGTLTVPADRAMLEGDTITLPVVIFPAEGDTKLSDPVLFLWWGPGAQTPFAMAFAYLFEELGETRDLIVVDQRGVGGADPAFECPAVSEIFYSSLDRPPLDSAVQASLADARKACLQTWRNAGLEPTQYTLAVVVEDLEDLRLGLGVQKWNIAGAGYGARVALEYAGTYPSTVRALAVDSVQPNTPQDYAAYPARYESLLARLFALCAADSKCAAEFPNLPELFDQAVERRNAEPLLVDVHQLDTGNRYTVYVDGGVLIEVTLAMIQLNFLNTFPELPRMLRQVASDEDEVLARILGQMLPFFEPPTSMVNWRYTCLEALPLSARDELLRADTSPVAVEARRALLDHFASCEIWEGEDALPAWQPPGGNMPLLALHGGLYTTERAWLEAATANFPERQIVEITDGVSATMLGAESTRCAIGLVQAFFLDPAAELDTQCASRALAPTWITLP